MEGQANFCSSTQDLVFYGGGAGAGKSFASLVDNLQGVHDPDYLSVFFRTTTTEITKGLWLEAKKLYMPILTVDGKPNSKWLGKAHISEKEKCITFPSGAKTFFSYLELDKHADNWYGLEITKIYFEECQQRSWYQFNVLLSRNRSKAKVTKGFRATLNPDRNHWVYDFVKRYLNEEGYPVKKLSGKTAYYTIINDQLYTSWNKKDLIEEFPDCTPLSYTYFPATYRDNKKLLEFDPKYGDKLNSLTEVKKKQLADGCWLDTGDTGLYFKRDWLRPATFIPPNAARVRSYDTASSEKTPTTYPDFTVGMGMAKDKEGNFYLYGNYVREFRDDDSMIHGCFRKSSGQRDQIMLLQAQHDGKDCEIVLPQDAGGAGKESFTNKVKFFQSNGFKVKKDPAGHSAKKGEKAEPFLTACEHGFVYIVRDSFTRESYEWLMSQLEVFNPNKKSDSSYKDDAMDACATGFNYLNTRKAYSVQKLPSIQSPTLKQELGV